MGVTEGQEIDLLKTKALYEFLPLKFLSKTIA